MKFFAQILIVILLVLNSFEIKKKKLNKEKFNKKKFNEKKNSFKSRHCLDKISIKIELKMKTPLFNE